MKRGTFIFSQQRLGRARKPFTIYKFRTMIDGAETLQNQYRARNEADGPVFKIYDDPRFTKIGRFLSHTGLDELPQMINVLKGEMALVGPRPLPVKEALAIPEKYQARFSVLPGMTSLWTIRGAHRLNFRQWMELDLEYVKNKSWWNDLMILLVTIKLIVRLLVRHIRA